MKAVLFAALVAAASAVTVSQGCAIPTDFVSAGCVPNPGYIVNVQCITNGVSTLTTPVNAANAPIFTLGGAATGCSVAANSLLQPTLGAQCPAEEAGVPAFRALSVACDTANGYFPSQGAAGNLVCIDPSTDPALFPTTAAYLLAGRLVADPVGAGVLVPALNQDLLPSNGFEATGTNALRCIQACTIPASICNGGLLSNGLQIVDTTNARLANNNCLVRPGTTVTFAPNGLPVPAGTTGTGSFVCPAGGGAGVLTNPGFLPLLGSGAISGPILRPRVEPGTLNAGFLEENPSVVATLRRAFTLNTLGQFSGRRVEAPVPFGPSAVDVVDVSGCLINDNICVQRAINAWRCRGFVVDSATRCLHNNIPITCPYESLGWECDDDDSKKGLLGLLGLLGLIPLCLCLLLCCGLLPCCLRRKKTEADVHFATFDPHAAPVAASVVAPMVPTAVCAEPFVGGCVDPYMGSCGAAPFAAPATPIF